MTGKMFSVCTFKLPCMLYFFFLFIQLLSSRRGIVSTPCANTVPKPPTDNLSPVLLCYAFAVQGEKREKQAFHPETKHPIGGMTMERPSEAKPKNLKSNANKDSSVVSLPQNDNGGRMTESYVISVIIFFLAGW